MRLLVLWSLVSIMSAFGGRRNKIKVQIFHICSISCGSLAAYPLPPPPPLTRSLTWRHIGRYKRQDIHFILTIAALYCCGRLGQDRVHLIGGSGGEGSSHCQQQQTIENPNRNQIVGFVAFANHREALRVACNLKCKSGLNCVTVRARLGDDSMRIDYTTKD